MLKEQIVVGKMNFRKSLIYVGVSLWMACFVLSASVVAQPVNLEIKVSAFAKKQCASMMFGSSGQSATLSQWFTQRAIDQRMIVGNRLMIENWASPTAVLADIFDVIAVNFNHISKFPLDLQWHLIKARDRNNNLEAIVKYCYTLWKSCHVVFNPKVGAGGYNRIFLGVLSAESKNGFSECFALNNFLCIRDCFFKFIGPGAANVNFFTAVTNGKAHNNRLSVAGGRFSFDGSSEGHNEMSSVVARKDIFRNRTLLEGVIFCSSNTNQNPIIISGAVYTVFTGSTTTGNRLKGAAQISDNDVLVKGCNFSSYLGTVVITSVEVIDFYPEDTFSRNVNITGNRVRYYDNNIAGAHTYIMTMLSRDGGWKNLSCNASTLQFFLNGEGVYICGLGKFQSLVFTFGPTFNVSCPAVTFQELLEDNIKECDIEINGAVQKMRNQKTEVVLLKSNEKILLPEFKNLSSNFWRLCYSFDHKRLLAQRLDEYGHPIPHAVCYNKDDVVSIPPKEEPGNVWIPFGEYVVISSSPFSSIFLSEYCGFSEGTVVTVPKTVHLKKAVGVPSSETPWVEERPFVSKHGEYAFSRQSVSILPVKYFRVLVDTYETFKEGGTISVMDMVKITVLQLKEEIYEAEKRAREAAELANSALHIVSKFDDVD